RHTRFSRDWSSDVCSSDLFEETHTSDPADGVPSDPRNYESSKIRDNSAFEASVALDATVEPAEDVVVTGGIKLAHDVFGASTDEIGRASCRERVEISGGGW